MDATGAEAGGGQGAASGTSLPARGRDLPAGSREPEAHARRIRKACTKRMVALGLLVQSISPALGVWRDVWEASRS